MRYHISKDGLPGECNATVGSCPLGGEAGTEDHFDNLVEAAKVAEARLKEQNGLLRTVSKRSEPTIPEVTSAEFNQEAHNTSLGEKLGLQQLNTSYAEKLVKEREAEVESARLYSNPIRVRETEANLERQKVALENELRKKAAIEEEIDRGAIKVRGFRGIIPVGERLRANLARRGERYEYEGNIYEVSATSDEPKEELLYARKIELKAVLPNGELSSYTTEVKFSEDHEKFTRVKDGTVGRSIIIPTDENLSKEASELSQRLATARAAMVKANEAYAEEEDVKPTNIFSRATKARRLEKLREERNENNKVYSDLYSEFNSFEERAKAECQRRYGNDVRLTRNSDGAYELLKLNSKPPEFEHDYSY